MMNYDPNLFCSGNRAKQIIKLTFAMWDYRCKHTFELRSNIKGLSAIKAAVEQIYEDLPGFCENDIPRIVLFNEAGDSLICDDEEGQGEDWLYDMLISAEIVSAEPAGRIFDDLEPEVAK